MSTVFFLPSIQLNRKKMSSDTIFINVDWSKWTESALFEKSLKWTPDLSYRTSHFACVWDLCAMLRPLLLICVHKRKRERRKEWFKTRTHNFMPVWNKITQMSRWYTFTAFTFHEKLILYSHLYRCAVRIHKQWSTLQWHPQGWQNRLSQESKIFSMRRSFLGSNWLHIHIMNHVL